MAEGKIETGPRLLTPLELQIMEVLWSDGAAPVSEVQEGLASPLAYTTVATMLGVLLRKKKVRRAQAGRGYRYEAVVSRQAAIGATLTDLVRRVFGGSGDALLVAMVDTNQLDVDAIERAAELLRQRKAEDGEA
jgi:BlaI family transcriptional regulator, penicillinase repressor